MNGRKNISKSNCLETRERPTGSNLCLDACVVGRIRHHLKVLLVEEEGERGTEIGNIAFLYCRYPRTVPWGGVIRNIVGFFCAVVHTGAIEGSNVEFVSI